LVAAERVKQFLLKEEGQLAQILYLARSLLMAVVAVVHMQQSQIIMALTVVLAAAVAYQMLLHFLLA
jgi:hypothetical protein